MPKYQFTGTTPEEFPSIVTGSGAWVASPGDLIELADDPQHSRLVVTTVKGDAIPAVLITDDRTDPAPVGPDLVEEN